MGISIVVPFLNMTKQFVGNINQVSQQINAVIMGLAGAQLPWYGQLIECEERTGIWGGCEIV